MYSVGLALEGTNMPTDVTGQEAILKTIASSEDVFYSVTSAAGLQEAFDDFAGAVLYAAENAVFEDALGADYNIQLANTTKRLVDGKEFTLTPAPTMEVRKYTIWTRAELEDANGNLSEENAKKVGTRKTDADGNYIYDTLEIVSFNEEGTQAYTGDDKTNNIMIDGVINAKTFWYNNSTSSVMIDVDGDATTGTDGKEFELKPETFLWKVGTIKSKEIALSYYVYLDDSLEGEASAGSYETNEYAILSYDNYLGNPCKKETVSPQMAWLSANVSYAYYLVNRDGNPVNANGDEVTFANREVVVHPTKYGEIKLNSIEDVESLKIASTGILDEGNYALFDYDAEYNLLVNSDATGGWEITVGNKKDENGNETDEKLPATTYVTDFSDTLAFTNQITSASETDNYDYTHTTVWFAVVWEPKAIDDAVVVDFGLPVDVHVLVNDFFGDFGTLEGVATGIVTEDGDVKTNEVTETDDTGAFGKVEVIKPATGANASNSLIRYTPNKTNGMQMNTKEVFTYSVEYTNTKLHTNNGFYYGELTVIPATTIYYEDDFVTLTVWDAATDEELLKEDGTKVVWDTVGEVNSSVTQDEDRPDDINYAFSTKIDANNVYGYDSAYKECSEYSLGSARKLNVNADQYGEAQFTFYGTGFDVISLTSNKTGTITVDVYEGTEVTYNYADKIKSFAVDTYYGYAYNDETDEWEISANNPDTLYQVPVMEVSGLPYGQYTVCITAAYAQAFDHNEAGNYDFYLDAIRIYDPANDGTSDAVIKDAYVADGEGWPYYEEVRDNVIDAVMLEDSENTEISGIVFIDSNDEMKAVSDYINYGPNNELYLAKGQAIAFNLDLSTFVNDEGKSIVDSVHIGLKSAIDGNVSYRISDGTDINAVDTGVTNTLLTATGMYYDITELKDSTIVIENTGDDGILSITDIKITFTENPGEISGVFMVSRNLIDTILANMNGTGDTENPEVSEEPEVEPFEPVKFTVKTSAKSVKAGKEVTVTVTTSDDVAAVSVDGTVINKYKKDRKSGNYVWTAKVRTSSSDVGEKSIEVIAYDKDANASESIIKTVQVTAKKNGKK